MKLFVKLLLCSAFFPAAFAQNSQTATPPKPCTQPEFKQMDFWVGEWSASWPGQNGQPDGHGTNTIRKILGECVIEENFSGQAFDGKSVSTFNVRSGKWQQTWVDSSGGYLDFVGGAEGSGFIYNREFTQNGKKTMQRMVWKNVTRDSFDWSWERSTDDGKTWTVMWPIHYTRKTVAASN